MFNVTKIRPQGFLHSSGFNEIIDSLSWALSELGHEVSVTENWLSSDPKDTNIIFGAELLSPQVLPRNSIIYNLEQATHPNMQKVRELAKGLKVWDYSAANVETWKASGQDVRHVPIGYTPNLTRIPKASVQDIDVLFFGFLTPRRLKIVQELKDAGLKIVATDRCYGGGRDNLISRAKIVLNVHHDGRSQFEIVRVSYLLANGKCVVSEKSSDDEDYADLHDGFYRGNDLVKAISNVMENGANESIPDYALKVIKRRDYVQTVKAALELPEIKNWKQPTVSDHAIMKVAARYHDACTVGDMKDFMQWLRTNADGKNILEIGTRDGASTSAFLMAVEPSARNPLGEGHVTSVDIADCSHLFRGHPQWSFVQADSKDILNLNLGGPFDIVLIDGDHTRMPFKTDLDNAYSMTKPGGMILCHDIAPDPSFTLEAMPGTDRPSIAVREEYFLFCETRKLKHQELPGENGMGVIFKPPVDDPKEVKTADLLKRLQFVTGQQIPNVVQAIDLAEQLKQL